MSPEPQLRLESSILDQISDAVVAIDGRRRITYFNHAAERQYGVSAAEALGCPIDEVYAWRWTRLEDEVEAAASLARTGSWRGENIHVRRDGTLLYVESTVSTLNGEDGAPAGMLAVIRDVSTRKRAEDALRQSEENYRTLFNSIDEGYLLADVIFGDDGLAVDIHYLASNPAATRMAGYDFTGRRLSEIDPNYEPYWYDIFGRVARTGVGERLERYAAPDDRWFSFYVFKGSGGDRRVAAVFQDITERKRREANAAFLAGLTNEFTSADTVDDIMQRVGATIGAYLKVVSVVFTDVDETMEHVTVCHGWVKTGALSIVGKRFRLEEYVTPEFKRLSLANELFVVSDTQADPRVDAALYAALQIHSWVVVPFHRHGQWRHYLTAYDAKARDWRADEIELFRELSNLIFPRLARARAEAELRESEARLADELADTKQLQDISSHLIHEDNAAALYEQILDAARSVMRAEIGSLQVFYPQRGELYLLAQRGFDARSAEFWKWVRPDAASTCGVALNNLERVIAEDVETCAFLTGTDDLACYRTSGIRAVQTTPLISRDGHVVGMISTHWREPHHPAERDLRLLDVIARQAADLIERRTAETVLRAAHERLQMAMNAGRIYAWEMNPVTGRLEWTEGMARVMGFPLPDHIDDAFKLIHPDDFERVTTVVNDAINSGGSYAAEYRLIDPLTQEVKWFHSQAVFTSENASGEPRLVGIAQNITDGKRAEAELRQAHHLLEQRVEERTRELQATAARLQSEVTERAAAEGRTRELLSRLITVQEEERRRIALNIHDDLGQQVSGLRIGLSLWETSADPVERAAQAARVQQLARDLDHSIDFLTSELHPAALDHLGISAALAELVRRWTERFGIAADYHAIGTDDLRLAADLESNLYRLVQEALHNIYKHAGASQVDVVFSHRDGHAVLMVEDDGRGFAPEQPSNHAGGLGLVGMKERAMLAGGQFDIESSPGAGTTVHVRLPYGKRPDEEPAAS